MLPQALQTRVRPKLAPPRKKGVEITVAGHEGHVGSVRQDNSPVRTIIDGKEYPHGGSSIRHHPRPARVNQAFGASPLELQLLQTLATSLTTQRTNMTPVLVGKRFKLRVPNRG